VCTVFALDEWPDVFVAVDGRLGFVYLLEWEQPLENFPLLNCSVVALLDRSNFFPPKRLDEVRRWFVEYLIFVEGVVCLDLIVEVIELAGPSLGFF